MTLLNIYAAGGIEIIATPPNSERKSVGAVPAR